MNIRILHTFTVGFLITSLLFGGVYTFASAQSSDLSAKERKELEKQLEQLEDDIEETNETISVLQAEGQSLKRDIAILESEIKRAKLQVQTVELEIAQLSDGIVIHSQTIDDLSYKIAKEKESLAQIIRKTDQIDQTSLVEVVLSTDDLSEFFKDIDSFAAIKESLQISFDQLRGARTETTNEKQALESERTDQQILRSQLVLAQQEVEKKEQEKRNLLAETQGKESLYKTIKANQESLAAQIRARLFPLRDTAAIPFGTAVEYAQTVYGQTGVRPALILAVLSVESDLGNNVGQCLVKNLQTGDGEGKNTGTFFSGVMKSPRDTVPFEQITKKLGKDWQTTPVSCPQPGGYGGAMGPTQFIPSTWELYESQLKNVLGVPATNPWNALHAITATGLYLVDVGAVGGSYIAEHTAAAKYNGGGYWQSSGPQSYANKVMAKAAEFQDDIDFLDEN